MSKKSNLDIVKNWSFHPYEEDKEVWEKPMEALKDLRNCYTPIYNGKAVSFTKEFFDNRLSIIENALKNAEKNEFELEVFKLAYEWKCNGVEGTYEEVLEQAKRSVEGWKEIEKNGYGTIITE